MVNILRRWNQPIMVVITVLVIVSFVYWGPNIGQPDRQNFSPAKLYGREYKVDEFKRLANRVAVHAYMGGLYIRTVDPYFNPRNPDRGINSEVVARAIVVDRECEALGITSTPAERLAILDSLDGLRDDFQGTFNPIKFDALRTRIMQPNGFSENDFDRVFLDGEVRAKKLRDLIGEGTTPLPAEIQELAARSEMKVDASYVAFKAADLQKEAKVTEEEIKKSYEESKGNYKTPQLRKVRFASFLLPAEADGKKRTKEQQTSALQDLATKAYDLAQELKKPGANFDELATKAGAKIEETKEYFSEQDAPKDFDENPMLTAAAFQLTKENPYSSHLSVDPKGSYVLQLKEIKEPEQKTLEMVKAEVEKKLLEAKAKDLALAKAKEVQPKLAEAIKGGKKFKEAAEALALKVEEFPSFSMTNPPNHPYSEVVFPATLKLAPGQISEALADGGLGSSGDALILHLDSRSAGDEKKVTEKLPYVTQMITGRQRNVVFRGWLHERELAAGMATAFAKGQE